jgi:uncharacterized protein (UPF0248 family)
VDFVLPGVAETLTKSVKGITAELPDSCYLSLKMMPIKQLLNRIRWDREFARGNFELGYFDRVENRIIIVPFWELSFFPAEPQAFRLTDAEGTVHRVPFHRVREVYKNGECIWRR